MNARRIKHRLPGDPKPQARLAQILRVDHAGEYGAVRIYEGQSRVIRKGDAADAIRHMAAQEAPHLDYFNNALVAQRARPSALLPLWHIGGFAMGTVTAVMGEKAAMACTAAVESVINGHYAAQVASLAPEQAELRDTLQRFGEEEQEHHDTAIAHGAEGVLGYPLLSAFIRGVTRSAIWVAERV